MTFFGDVLEVRSNVLEVRQLWPSCAIRECFPSGLFSEHLKKLHGTDDHPNSIDLSGMDCVTDEVFLILNKCCEKDLKLSHSIFSVNCTGCVHVTNYGVASLANAFPNLKKVVMDGCKLLTERAVFFIEKSCPEIQEISMVATNLSIVPNLKEKVKLSYEGCPILYKEKVLIAKHVMMKLAPKSSEEVFIDKVKPEMPEYKLVILTKQTCSYNVTDLLLNEKHINGSGGKVDVVEDHYMSYKKKCMLPLLAYKKQYFNILEIHGKTAMYTPLLSERCIYTIAVDMNTIENDQLSNPLLHIMTRINSIRGQVPQSPILILAMHDDAHSEEMIPLLHDVATQMEECFKNQMETLTDHLDLEAWDSPEALVRDFQTQQRFSRSCHAREFENYYMFFRVNVDTLQVENMWPQASNSSTTENDSLAEMQRLEMLLKNNLEEYMTKYYEPAISGCNSMNKSDLTELKSYTSPPRLVIKCMQCVSTLLLSTSKGGAYGDVTSWSTTKRLLSDPRFTSKLIDYNKDELTEREMKYLKIFIEDEEMNKGNLAKVSRAGVMMWGWVEAIYKYGIDIMPLLKKYRILQLKSEKATATNDTNKVTKPKSVGSYNTSIGSGTILAAVMKCQEKLDWMYPAGSANSIKFLPALKLVVTVEKAVNSLGCGIFTLQQVVDELRKDIPDIEWRLVSVTLKKLHEMGKLLFWSDTDGEMVTGDMAWFIKLLSLLQAAHKISDKDSLLNGARHKALGPDVRLFTLNDLEKLWNVEASQMHLICKCLRYNGILQPAPRRSVTSPHPDDPWESMFCFSHVDNKPALRLEPEKVLSSSSRFRLEYWPETSSLDSDDASLTVFYRFTMGIPPSLIPMILSECIQLHPVTFVWRWGFVASCGAAEIQVKHNVHGTLLSSSLDVEARCSGLTDCKDIGRMREYMWSIVSNYLDIIEYHINKFSHLHFKLRMPCQGDCSKTGLPETFSPVQIPPQLDFTVNCRKCQKPSREMAFLSGRTSPLPMHDYFTADGNSLPINTMAPYGALYRPLANNDTTPTWICNHCGITKHGGCRLWTMKTDLYPAFTDTGFTCWTPPKAAGQPPEETSLKQGSCISIDSSVGEDRYQFFYYKHALFHNGPGISSLEVTILKSGTVRLLIGSREYLESTIWEEDGLNKSTLTYNLTSGELDKSKRDLRETAKHTPFQVGDTLAVEVVGEVVDDSLLLQVVFKRNGEIMTEERLPYRSYIGIILENGGEESPKALLQAQAALAVKTSHFTVGSALLYKHGVGSQYAIGRVVDSSLGQLTIQTGQLKVNIDPESSLITPVGLYSESISITINGKLIVKKRDELIRYLAENKCSAAPLGLFTHLHQNKATFSNLNILDWEPRVCTTSSHSPEALEQSFLSSNASHPRVSREYVLLPRQLTTEFLLNPHRRIIQNLHQQHLHFLCKGNEWSRSGCHDVDVHFMDFGPCEVDEKFIYDLIRTSEQSHVYWFLQKSGTMHLFKEKVLPLVDTKTIPENEVLEGLRHILNLYRCTFLLLVRLRAKVTEMAYNRKATSTSKIGKELTYILSNLNNFHSLEVVDRVSETQLQFPRTIVKNHLKKIHDQHFGDDAEFVDTLNSKALCPTHAEMNKKSFLKACNFKEMVYAVCVRFVHIGHTDLKDKVHNFTTNLPNLEGVTFDTCNLSSIECLCDAKKLKYLHVPKNHIRSLPDNFHQLSDTLEYLELKENPFEEIPDCITTFTKLTSVNLNGTLVRKLPENIGDLMLLRFLDISFTMVDQLPDSFKFLKRLDYLAMAGIPWMDPVERGSLVSSVSWKNWTNTHPQKLIYQEKLTEQEREDLFNEADTTKDGSLNEEELADLNKKLLHRFPHVGLTSNADDTYGGIPPQIFYCRNLRTLCLNYQAIKFIPDKIGQLRKLKQLLLNNCPMLESISGNVGKGYLKVITVKNCEVLRTPPKEVISQGMSVTIAYLKRLSQGSVACHRTKLMFVGLGGAGKTSLMRALMSANHVAPTVDGEGITDGIDISNWTVNRQGVALQYSVWDFAGQTIYYNTHQFFLSNRAVYVLVWNTRLGFEHSGLEFWLSSIACHSPKAPIFIIGTHADQITNPELPEDSLRKRYANIEGFFTLSSLTGKGVPQFLDSLLDVTMEQPYIGEMVPECYINLEKSILSKRNQSDLLMWKDVQKMANVVGVYGSEVAQAVQFLHDLGTLQHFDNELLRDRVVINPQWIVDVMACVVSVHNKFIKEGRLYHRDVGNIWKKYPKDLHKWLLRLTEVFDLTFPLDGQKENIVPCLLPQKEPQFDWPTKFDEVIKESQMVYKFDYLPAGLFNRLQVRLHQFSDSASLWKMGSLLDKNGHGALLQQVSETQVIVKAHGQRPENMILLVHEVVESLIFEVFEGVKYEYLIPCMDCARSETHDPTMFSSKILRRAVELKALFLQCHTFFHTLSMRDVQSAMPPTTHGDYSLQLQGTVQDLQDLEDGLSTDVFLLYCHLNLPTEDEIEKGAAHPAHIAKHLKDQHGILCNYIEDLHERNPEDLTMAMKNSKIVVLFMSDEFVADPQCQAMFYHAKDKLHRPMMMLMVGSGINWKQTDIGGRVGHWLYINFQRSELFNDKIKELAERLKKKLTTKQVGKSGPCDVFVSYCWVNSGEAVECKQARKLPGALGQGDPRAVNHYLQDKGVTCWLDIDQTGKRGLFEDISEGMKACKVVVACVSDEYVQSSNCQMEFRFAHIALRKPIILAVVGTGFLWESTEIGMLSLGYPKVNLQLATESAHDHLLQLVKEKLDSSDLTANKQPTEISERQQKHNAFMELYELAQRKFLRQIISCVDDSVSYPRLFVADLRHTVTADSQSEDEDENTQEDKNGDKTEPTFVFNDLQAGQFCIKTLCEHEGGWHSVDDGLSVDLSGKDLVKLWEVAAPYMSRLLAILKHSNVNLNILTTPEGNKLLDFLEKKAAIMSDIDLKPVYLLLRKYMMTKDERKQMGGLARCYLPSGKVLWLCKEHQRLPRVTVLQDSTADEEDTSPDDEAESEMTKGDSDFGLLEQDLLAGLKLLLEDKTTKSEVSSTTATGKKTTTAQAKSETTIDKQEDDKPNDDVRNRIKATSEESKITDTVPSDGDGDNKQLTSQVSETEQEKCTPAEKEKIKKRVSGRSMAALGPNDSADPTSRACIIL